LQAFLVSGKPDREEVNRPLLAQNKTGHWVIAENRIHRGDLMFLILPSAGYALSQRRELYAGVVRVIEPSSLVPTRKVVEVEHFFQLPDIEGNLKGFLEGKIPLAGNRILTVWDIDEDQSSRESEFEQAVKKSSQLSAAERQRRLDAANPVPKRIAVISVGYDRNPDVVASVLLRAISIYTSPPKNFMADVFSSSSSFGS
jgi:hypothetical protein